MKVRLAPRQTKPQRGGFTLIELLVVISIIAVLASLILPGVQNARATARRMQCLNNMRNVGIAVQNYATNNNGRLPPLVRTEGNEASAGPPVVTESRRQLPWSVFLLPYLDQTGLYDRILENPLALSTATDNPLRVGIPVFTCADDPRSNENGAMSFVANGGWYPDDTIPAAIDEDTNFGVVTGDSSDLDYATAWRKAGPPVPGTADIRRFVAATGTTFRNGIQVTQDQVKDGTSQTLLLSENLQGGNWFSTTTGHIAFVVPVEITVAGTQTPLVATEYTQIPESSRINNGFATALSGKAPRPSSFHSQVVNVIFADGSGRNLAQGIDQNVYRSLISSNGMAVFREAPLSGNAF